MSVLQDTIMDGLLCYISTAKDSFTEQALVSILASFYGAEKISAAKEMLFDAMKTTGWKRAEGDFKADLNDIISLFRKGDEKDSSAPKVASDGFRETPPSSDFEVIPEKNSFSFAGDYSAQGKSSKL